MLIPMNIEGIFQVLNNNSKFFVLYPAGITT